MHYGSLKSMVNQKNMVLKITPASTRKARKRQSENAMRMLTAAEICLVQFVIRRLGGFVNSQIHIIKNLTPAGLT
jgi:hypothetical protein